MEINYLHTSFRSMPAITGFAILIITPKQVYSMTIMNHVMKGGESSQGTLEPITPETGCEST